HSPKGLILLVFRVRALPVQNLSKDQLSVRMRLIRWTHRCLRNLEALQRPEETQECMDENQLLFQDEYNSPALELRLKLCLKLHAIHQPLLCNRSQPHLHEWL